MTLAGLLDFLFPLRPDEALVRELAPESLALRVEERIFERTSPAAATLLPYADAHVRAAIHEAKYRGNEQAFALLAEALATYLRTSPHPPSGAVLVPVPLSTARHRERGFNQSQEIAARAAAALHLPVAADLLERVRETPSQVSLPRRARWKNLRGAFTATRPLEDGYLYIVIDDVVTTGATMQAALDALADAGASRILPVALAH